MKPVLAFCLFKYFRFGGLQRDFLSIALECRNRGYAIRVYTLSWEGEVPDGFDVRIVPVRAYTNHGRVKKYFQWLEKDLKKFPVAGTVGFNRIPGLDVYYAADVCFREKAFSEHGRLYRWSGRYRQYAAFEDAVFGAGSKTVILMISKQQMPVFVKHYGTPEARMHLLPPNIAVERFMPKNAAAVRAEFRRKNGLSPENKLIVQVGSGFKTKGVDRSIRALSSLPETVRNTCRLWVAGEDHAAKLRRLARKLKVADCVEFKGGRTDIPDILLGADLLIHPAYHENTGTVLLEAVAAGLPVICTAVCGYAEHILAANCGRVIPEPFRQEELNRRLVEMLTKMDLAALRTNALRYARSVVLNGMPQKAADIIEEVIGGKCFI